MEYRLLRYMKSVEEYEKILESISDKWNLLTMLGSMSNTGMDMSDTRTAFESLTQELLEKLGAEILKKSTSEMQAKAQVAVDIVIRNLFERTADIGFLATDDDIRSFLRACLQPTSDDHAREILRQKRQKLKNRFKEYVAKYSVYCNIILMDTKGTVLVQLDETNPVKISQDPLISEALHTAEEYVEIYRKTDLVPHEEKALVYSYRVTHTDQSGSKNLGVLSLVFKFEDEMKGIFNNLITEQDWMEIMLLDAQGEVISCSDPYHIPIGMKMDRVLDEDYKIVRFAGREYLAKTCATKGYQGFSGLGWYGHVMLPIEHAFDKEPNAYKSISSSMLEQVLKVSTLFSAGLKKIPEQADRIQKELDVTVWNGNVLIANLKSGENSSSKALLSEISNTGSQTKKVFEESISNLNQTVLSAYLDDAQFNASLAIDIMDRNLYERANDCRWWALTSDFKTILSKPQLEARDKEHLESILSYINNLYTVYTNLFIFDTHGTIVAVSNKEEAQFVGTKVEAPWVEKALALTDTQRYSVSDFEKTPLYAKRSTYIYSAGITDSSSEQVVGGIGVVFDSEPEFKAMLMDALPRTKEGTTLEGSFGLFCDREKLIISSTDEAHTVGSRLALDDAYFRLDQGKGSSSIVELNGSYYVVGMFTSHGYREFKKQDQYDNDVIAFIFVKISDPISSVAVQELPTLEVCPYPTVQGIEETVDISTFCIGTKFFGVESRLIDHSLSHQNITRILGSDDYFLGVVNTKDLGTVGVVSLNKLLGIEGKYDPAKDELIVLKSPGQKDTKFAIVISYIMDSPEIPVRSIKSYAGDLAGGSALTKSVVVPDGGQCKKEMLSILDIDAVFKAFVKKDTYH